MRGYAANVTETCEEGNKLQLIVDVAVEPSSADDGQMLADWIDDLAQRTDVMTIYADGGYNGPDVDEELAKHNGALEQTAIWEQARMQLGTRLVRMGVRARGCSRFTGAFTLQVPLMASAHSQSGT